ncbi:MAG: amidotransferase [Bacteroidota bacterium]
MTLGLLICDRVAPEFLDTHGDYPAMFESLFESLDCRTYFVCDGHFPESPQVCDAWLISGSRRSVYEEVEWIQRLKSFVQLIHQSGKKCIGVCFGHQMLAEALGGKVEKAAVGWCIGVHAFELHSSTAWLKAAHSPIRLLMMCQDQVIQLPPDSRVLASAADCPVGMFLVSERMLGLQAHPEFSKAYTRALMESRMERIGAQRLRAGIDSLQQDVDRSVIKSWLLHFLAES